MTTRAERVVVVPDEVCRLVPEHDHVDLFTISAPGATTTTAEQWMRAAFEPSSGAGRFLAWQAVLNLRLDPRPAPDRIVGWQVVDQQPTRLRMTARSWYVIADLVCLVDADRVSIATFLTYRRAVGRLVWTPMSTVHRSLMPGVLVAAARRVGRVR